MRNLLKEKHALTKLREELEGRREKLCRSYKGFGHLACNYRNKGGEKKGKVVPQNKFEILMSRVMQCGLEKRIIKRQKEVRRVECFKCGEEKHKYREYSLWQKARKEGTEKKIAHIAKPQKAQQKELRRAKKEGVACVAKL